MADNPKSLASLADDLEHGLTPAEMERVCRYVASKGWQGNLPYMRATLAAIEDAGFAVVPREAAAALRAPSKSVADDLEALAKRMQTGLPNRAADLCFRAAAALRAPTIAADAVCGWCALEDCKECPLRRKDHACVTTHDYEPAHYYVCAGCPGDVLWDSDNYTEHPGYDHDFDPIPFATPSPTIAAPSPSNEGQNG